MPCLLQVSAGGLVSALMGVQSFKTCWIGWPGLALITRDSVFILSIFPHLDLRLVWAQVLHVKHIVGCQAGLRQLEA